MTKTAQDKDNLAPDGSAQEDQPAQSTRKFAHLHAHTHYTMLGASIRIPALMEKVESFGMPAVALADSNNLFGAIEFYFAARKRKIKPIIGCEVMFSPDDRLFVPSAKALRQIDYRPYCYHLVVLCKNMKGYQNLSKLLTEGYLNTQVDKSAPASAPRALVTRKSLEKYREGLIILSGGLKSELTYLHASGEHDQLVESVDWFKKTFGEDYYFELQDANVPEQDEVNKYLYELGKKKKIASVATTSAYYLNPEDAEAQEVLQCVELGKNLDFERPESLVPHRFCVKSADEMYSYFESFDGVCEETLKIADKCNVEFHFEDEDGKPIYHLPDFRPEGVSKKDKFDTVHYMHDEARKGLKERFESVQFKEIRERENWPELKKVYEKRLEDELAMIAKTGFSGYFLIVADFIIWAKKNAIPVGPGRGSGAGSLVAYSLKITDIDPIELNLLFERFINPERISMPDFDVDFCQDRRGEVIEYVTQKYGKDNVSQIITFGKLQARAVVKDVGRVLGLTFAEMDVITKLFPDELNITLSSAIEKEPRLAEKIESDPKIKTVMDYSLKLEGLCRSAGVHAAGVIITEEPIVNYCPLYQGKEGVVVTQFDKDFGEKIGLVKFDFLGLKTLTVVSNAVRLVREGASPGTKEEKFDIDYINYKDQKVYDLISSGDTDGVFQVESSGMKDLCVRLQPESIEDLTAINALYRPGPLGSGMVDDFIDRKHGRQEIAYELDALEPILKDTYGVILYQEQVMQIARELAGYSLGQADMLRRAMGKKKADEMARHREIFLKGAAERKIPSQTAESIYDLMAKFAEYGFNKSHSAAYAVLTYQTAFLKTYYPAEFMAALMTTELNNTDKLTRYIGDAKAHGIPVLSPDVNLSQKTFSVEKVKDPMGGEKKGVRFGLEAIKGVGGIAVDLIIDARQGKGEFSQSSEPKAFESVVDFCRRVSTRKVNKKVLEALTLSGAFDSIAEVNRRSLFESLTRLLEHASEEQEEKTLGQSSLFDSFSAEEVKLISPVDKIFDIKPDWSQPQRLANEKKVVGFYVSGHPMDNWQKIFDEWLHYNTKVLKERAATFKPKQPEQQVGRYVRPVRKQIKMGGLITSVREIMTKKGSRMAFAEVEDAYGKLELIFFPEAYENALPVLQNPDIQAEPVVLTGELETKEETVKIFVKSVEKADDLNRDRVKKVTLKVPASKIRSDQLRELKKSFLKHRGRCSVSIEFEDPRFRTRLDLPDAFNVSGTPQLAAAVNEIFGSKVVSFQ